MRMKWFGVLLAVGAVFLLGTSRPRLPGALGVVYAEIRVGTSWEEATTLFATSGGDNVDGKFVFAVLRDGTRLGEFLWYPNDPAMRRLPPAGQMAEGYLNVYDRDGRDLYVDLGPGGMVTGIRFKSRSTWESWRHTLARLTGT